MGYGGMGIKSHAEYLTLAEAKVIITIPNKITYEQAAACLEGAIYALSSMIDKVNPKDGQRGLVNGASGAIGSAAVQLLKYLGVHVTAVCNSKNLALVKSLRADKVIDYSKEDFSKDDQKYNFVFDTVAKAHLANANHCCCPAAYIFHPTQARTGRMHFYRLQLQLQGTKKLFSPSLLI
jgi:NADPH:quinone reductase-like Zn-dependent oxidoreductase